MLGQHVAHRAVDLAALLFQTFMGAAPFFGGVGGQLASVDGEHLLADQTHVIADQQYLLKELGDFFGGRGDELGDGCEVGAGIGGQGHEQHVLVAKRLDAPAAGDAPGVGQQHDLEQQRRVVGTAAGVLVAVLVVKDTQVEFLIDQVVQGVFERAGQDLAIEADRDKSTLGLIVFGKARRHVFPPEVHSKNCRHCSKFRGFSTASTGSDNRRRRAGSTW